MKGGMPKGSSWKVGDPGKRERMERYLEWILLPAESRVPSTQKALAAEMDVIPETLRRYAKDPWFQREKIGRERTLNRVERVGPVLEALYVNALSGNVSDSKAWLYWV